MTKVVVDPGVCGFRCEIEVRKDAAGNARVSMESGCAQVSKLNENLGSLTLEDIFTAPGKNKVFDVSQQAGCHATCSVALAVLKCLEVEMGMALPRDVAIRFDGHR
jgi:hypothetical protein